MNPLAGIAGKLAGGTAEFVKEEAQNIRNLPRTQVNKFKAQMAALPRSFIATAFSESPGIGGVVLNWYDKVSGFGAGNTFGGGGRTPDDPESKQAKTPIEKLDLVARRQKQTNTTLEKIGNIIQHQAQQQKSSQEAMMRAQLQQIRSAQEASEAGRAQPGSVPSNVAAATPEGGLDNGLLGGGMLTGIVRAVLPAIAIAASGYAGWKTGSEIYERFLSQNEKFRDLTDKFFGKMEEFFQFFTGKPEEEREKPEDYPIGSLQRVAGALGVELQDRPGLDVPRSVREKRYGAISTKSSGSLVRHLESKNNYAINAADSRNTRSYGAYQFNTKGGLPGFLKFLKERGITDLDGLTPGTKEFNQAWNALTNGERSAEFKQLQDEYAAMEYRDPALSRFKEVMGMDVKTDSLLSETLFSTAIPLGRGGMSTLLNNLKGKYSEDEFQKLSDFEQAKAVNQSFLDVRTKTYRSAYDPTGRWFDPNIERTLANRIRESNMVLETLEYQRKQAMQQKPIIINTPSSGPSGGGNMNATTVIVQNENKTDATISNITGSYNGHRGN